MNEEEWHAFFAGVVMKESSLIEIQLIRQHRKNMLKHLELTDNQRQQLEGLQ